MSAYSFFREGQMSDHSLSGRGKCPPLMFQGGQMSYPSFYGGANIRGGNVRGKMSYTRHAHMRPNCHRNCRHMDKQATELIEEIDRRCTLETKDSKETIYLYQRIAIAIQRGNALSFTHTFDIDADINT